MDGELPRVLPLDQPLLPKLGQLRLHHILVHPDPAGILGIMEGSIYDRMDRSA